MSLSIKNFLNKIGSIHAEVSGVELGKLRRYAKLYLLQFIKFIVFFHYHLPYLISFYDIKFTCGKSNYYPRFSIIFKCNPACAANIAADQIVNAEKMYDLHFTSAKRDSMVDQLKTNFQYYRYLHSFNLPNSVPLPQWFDPVLPEMSFNTKQNKIYWNIPENV
jgi:hypothetical protein